MLRRLTWRQREVLAARYVLGLNEEETARALGITLGTVAATSAQASEAFRALIGDRSTTDAVDVWTVREFAEVSARATLPPRDRWIPRGPTHAGTKVASALALAALVLVGIVLIFAEPSRLGIGEPATTPSPTFSRNDSGTPLPTEAEAWGGIWSEAKGVAVLRPTWLPKGQDEYQFIRALGTSRDGLFNYDMRYYDVRSTPGAIAWNVDFFADSLETEGGGFIHFGGVPETVTIRGRAAELTGNGSPGWVLVWSDGNYRYAIQAFAISREDLLRIANSLAPVIDGTGRTSP